MDKISLRRRILDTILIVTPVWLVIACFPNWVFAILASILIGFALSEFFNLVERKGVFVYKYFGVIIGMLVPIIIYFQMGTEGYFTLEPFFIVIACLFTFVLLLIRKDSSQAVSSIAVTMFGLLYIGWFFSFFVKIKFMPQGSLLVAFLLVVTKMSDIGAYFIGSLIGRHSLIKRISPKKTVEGTVGGLICSIIAALASKLYLPSFSYWNLFTLGLLLGILAETGDLAESLLKRDCGAKDSGAKLSGFGGVLDIIDSLLFAAPIFYFYLQVVPR